MIPPGTTIPDFIASRCGQGMPIISGPDFVFNENLASSLVSPSTERSLRSQGMVHSQDRSSIGLTILPGGKLLAGLSPPV